ncbi:MAG TPA: four helix bundle protein [Gemmatimonadaceae bacterium]|nr:four helix bundle protein [Gemmatimonadaceae bacterium]
MANADGLAEHWIRDPLSRMRVYQLYTELIQLAWNDCETLKHHRVTEKVAGQLYAAVGSIGANLGEGYSRSSGRDHVRFYEYALGSARESMVWYDASVAVLGDEIVKARARALEEIRRLLLAIIPRERDRLIRPRSAARP